MLRREHIGGAGEHEPASPIVEIDEPLERQRQFPGALRFVDDQRRAVRTVVERDVPPGPEVAWQDDRFVDHGAAHSGERSSETR